MQVKYANHLIKNILELAVQKAGRPRVIIIQGDHGYRFYTDAKLDAAFENLNAYYFSDGDYGLLYNGISPVNAFRVVLNKYFGCSLPLVKDSRKREPGIPVITFRVLRIKKTMAHKGRVKFVVIKGKFLL